MKDNAEEDRIYGKTTGKRHDERKEQYDDMNETHNDVCSCRKIKLQHQLQLRIIVAEGFFLMYQIIIFRNDHKVKFLKFNIFHALDL